MVIETRHFGAVELAERDVIFLPRGLYGFESLRRVALLRDRREDSPFFWMQNVEGREPCFVVADPSALLGDYAPALPAEAVRTLALGAPDELRLLVLVTVPHDFRKTTMNLRCPVAVNARTNRALQVILEDEALPMRCPLFQSGAAPAGPEGMSEHAGADASSR